MNRGMVGRFLDEKGDPVSLVRLGVGETETKVSLGN